MTDIEKLIAQLAEKKVKFVIIGGVAASIHGSAQVTLDLDICYARDEDNLKRIVEAIAPLRPRLRGAPQNLPFLWDQATLRQGLNFTLTTDWGDLDLLADVPGVGTFEHAQSASARVLLFGVRCAVLSLPALIAAKRASARPRDLNALPELEALLEATKDPPDK